jgi:Family of unknown function (DUF6218)
MTVADSESISADVVADSAAGVTGHVVIEAGPDTTGEDSLAVWHFSLAGQPTGAWIAPTEQLSSDSASARRLLELTQRRSILCWSTTKSGELLHRLAKWAEAESVPDWDVTAVRFPDVLAEIAERRHMYEEAVNAYRATTKSKITQLEWRIDIPAKLSALDELKTLALPVRQASARFVAEQALVVGQVTRWIVELWKDTEKARHRRQYLSPLAGDAPLPPRWLNLLRAAHEASVR